MALPKEFNEDLILVGEGAQGRVYLLNQARCIKVYKKSKFFRRELACLRRARENSLFPKIYDWGDNYIIREYIPGISLADYLREKPFTDKIASQLLEIYRTFEKLGFKRLDTRLEHVIITPQSVLKIIDPTNAMNKREDYPKRMLAGLRKLDYEMTFLDYIQRHDPELTRRWKH